MPTSRRRQIPGYLLHKPTGQARVRIDGRDYYLGTYDSPASWERYHQLLAARKSPGAVVGDGAPPRAEISITELCAKYLEWVTGYYVKNGRPTSQVDVIRMSLRALRKLYGETLASKFGPPAFEALQKCLVDEAPTRSYVNIVSSELRRLFKWAARKELVPVTVHQALAAVPGLA